MIKIYNRKSKTYEIEKVAGEKYLNWIYSSPAGKNLAELLIKKKIFSKLYGMYCDSRLSMKKIPGFITDLNIDMSIYEKSVEQFHSFNDFFIRKVKKQARPVTDDRDALVSPGDGRLTAYEGISMDEIVQVKGFTYSLKELINNEDAADKYQGGTCLILRLCPTDYHRFHFVDDGICGNTSRINGHYYSVNPVALEKIPKLFCQNKREWCMFASENFGDVLHIEVGATCVGSIIQTYVPGNRVFKGDEKGYFKFGGSTTILFLEKDKAKIDEDITIQTSLGFETKVLMGESIGRKI